MLLSVVILTLCACASQPEGSPLPAAWARADGRPVTPGLLDIDSTYCRDEMQSPDAAARGGADKADRKGYSRAMIDDFVSCMRAHGYVQVKS